MKFSRAKLQHLKWVRRKEFIRINCFIIIAILVMVLLFMGFPIVSDAAEAFTYDDTVMSHLNFNDTDLLISRNVTIPDGYTNGLFDNDNYYVYFDNDLSNGSFIWDSRIDDYTFSVNDNSLHISDCPTYSIYFTDDSHITLEFYGVGNCCYKYFCENANSSGLIRMFYSYPNGYNNNSNVWLYPDDNFMVRCSFTKSSDGNFYLNSSRPISFYNNSFTSNNRYINGIYCAYGTYTNNLIVTNVPTYTCPIEPYLKRASYIPDGDTVRTTDWLNVEGVQINPNYSSGGGDSIRNHEKPYEGSCVYMQYSNLNTGNMHIVVKSDEFQKTENASIKLKCSVSAQIQYNSSVGIQESNVGVDGPFQNNFSSPNETFNNGPYVEYEIPLSSFNNSGDYTISLEDINKGLWNSNEKTLYSFNTCFQNNSTGLATAFKTFFFSILSTQNIIPDYSNMPNFLYSLNSEVWDVQGVFCIGESEEIFDSFQLDMISGTIENQDYDLPNEDDVKEVLDSPTVPNNYVPQPYKPSYPDAYNVTVPNNNTDVNNDNSNSSESNDNITVSGGENSVNVVTNINQGNKYPEKGVMQSFVRIINNDKNNTVNDIDTLIGGSAYIQLMNNALVAVPDQVWSIWITALKAILGIAVSAFFLKILINWAT